MSFSNDQVAHLWANRSRDSAHGSNFYFEGDTIYSYGSHFPIARHYKGVILFTTQGYSVTTARHISEARNAIPSSVEVFHVKEPTRPPSRESVEEYRERIKSASLSVGRAKNPDARLRDLEDLISEANRFCHHFGFKTRFSAPDNIEQLRAKAKKSSERERRQAAAKKAKFEKECAADISDWLNGTKIGSLPFHLDRVLLRKRGDTMETSKGAVVPISEAEKAFRFCVLMREKGWRRNGDRFQIGDFQLDSVSTAGVVAGCHHVHWDEINRFASAMGWT